MNIDFPLALLRQIDAECARIGVTRPAWSKMACDERLRQGGSTGRHARDPSPVQSQVSGLKQQKYIDRARTQLGLHG